MIRFTERPPDSTLPSLGDQWASNDLGPMLRTLVNQAASYIYRVWHQDLIVTCLLRTPDEDKALYHDPNHEPGVHCFGRGADISVRFMSSHEVQGLCNYLNEMWIYDPARPNMLVAVYEDASHPDSSAPHIHLQSHPNTVTKFQSDVPPPESAQA